MSEKNHETENQPAETPKPVEVEVTAELEDETVLRDLGDILTTVDAEGILVAIIMEALKDPEGFDADRALLTVKAFGGEELIAEAQGLLGEEERIAGGGAGILSDEEVAELMRELEV